MVNRNRENTKCLIPCLGNSPSNSDPGERIALGSIKGLISELHISAINGKVEQLRTYLATFHYGQLTDQDEPKHRTPLHYAVTYWDEPRALEMSQMIIDKVRGIEGFVSFLVNAKDKKDETPLHLATRFRHPTVVQLLLASSGNFNMMTQYGKTGLDQIYRFMPQIICPLLDESVKFMMTESESGIPKLDKQHVELSFNDITGADNGWSRPDTHSLFRTLKNTKTKYKDLLVHPLVQLFLHVKMERLSPVFRTSIAFHILWSGICAWYLFYMYVYWCPSSRADLNTTAGNGSGSAVEGIGIQCEIGSSWLRLSKGAVIATSILMGIKEVCELVTQPPPWTAYFKKLENIGQILLIVLVTCTTVPVFRSYPYVTVYPWHYQSAAFAMLLPWGLLLGQVGKTHRFGIYIEIFIRVCKSFIKFTLAFISILIAFALSFAILMPQYSTFRSIPSAMVKVLVMMTGEFEYEDLFSDEKMEFAITAQIIFVCFVAIVTITLFNLLIGINVSDIQGLRDDAELCELASRLERIHLMEEFLIKCNVLLKKCSCGLFDLKKRISIHQTEKITLPIKKMRKRLRDDVRRLAYKNKPLAA